MSLDVKTGPSEKEEASGQKFVLLWCVKSSYRRVFPLHSQGAQELGTAVCRWKHVTGQHEKCNETEGLRLRQNIIDSGQQPHMGLLCFFLLGDGRAADSFLTEQRQMGDLPSSLSCLECNAYYS